MRGIDVIGDIHGCADKLTGLLESLGYETDGGAFHHPDRSVVFVGDLIDRGPKQVEVLEIVRPMQRAGSAQVLMGNHEFNAISYVTPNPELMGAFMRPRSGPDGSKNRDQHAEFLSQVGEDSDLHRDVIAWFKTLPLWLDLGELRVVHACWHQPSIDILSDLLGTYDSMSDEFVVAANTKGAPAYEALEVTLKGPEVDLGARGPYLDKEGRERNKARIRWWDGGARTLRDLAEIPPGTKAPSGDPFEPLPDEPSEAASHFRYDSDVPVFFGHYWFSGKPRLAAPRAACVDFSAVYDGPLMAYRWEGESELTGEHFVGFGEG